MKRQGSFKNSSISRLFSFFTILSFFINSCSEVYSQENKMLSGLNSNQGPEWISENLLKDGVLESPSYEFTNQFENLNPNKAIKGLFFEGLPYKGNPTKVFCWVGVPQGLGKNEKLPAVVLVHGGGGTAFSQWVKKWNDKGYIAISIALEGQIPGSKIKDKQGNKAWPRFEFSGPTRKGFFKDVVVNDLKDQWFYHAIADIMKATSLLKKFPEVDANKIGITGISWGGILTNVVTGIDHRYAFSIPVYGCGYLQETPLYKRQMAALTKEQKNFYLQNWEPSLYIPLQKQPTLFVNGTNDKHFTMNSFTKSFQASSNEKYLRVEHNMPHGHGPGWKPKAIYNFANYVLQKTNKPIKIRFKKIAKNNKLEYSYQGKIKKAYLYYTTDTSDWAAKNYNWKEIEVPFSSDKKSILITLSKNTVAHFVNTISVNGLISSSKMKMH